MELVNVEDLKVLVAVESEGSIRYGKLVTDLFDDIPTVDAIPIEWIRKYIAEEGIYPNRELLSVEQADAIERMIENWEKENEQKTSD